MTNKTGRECRLQVKINKINVMHTIPFSDCHYFGKNIMDEAWGMTITTTGYQEIPPGVEYPSKGEHPAGYYFQQKSGRVLNEYQIIYVTRGGGVFNSVSAGKLSVKAGDIFMLFPGEWHVYNPNEKTGWATYWIGFRGQYPDYLNDKGFFQKTAPVYRIGLHEMLVSLFRQEIEYYKTGSPAPQQVLAGVAINLLAHVYALNQDNKYIDEAVQIINKAKIMIRENIYRNLSLEEVAASLNISYSLFRSLFKQHTGMAPGQYQKQLRIQKAKELLITTTKTVKEVSIMLNFESGYYFSTFFKQQTGITPSAFREGSL